jgi:uncharacterized protein
MATLAQPQTAKTTGDPTQPCERVAVIDMVRGFALFGILLVNMQAFNRSLFQMIIPVERPSGLDQLAFWLIRFFGEGKFYSTFAFLFGLGLVLMVERLEARHAHPVATYGRRMAVLFVIGLVHAYLFWVGDILILYSLLGTLTLLLFRNRQPRTLLIWAVIFLFIPLVINAALLVIVELARLMPDGPAMIDRALAEQIEGYRIALAEADRVYSTGSFAAVTAQRASEMLMVYTTWPFMAFNVWAMFLFGMYAGKRHLFFDVEGHLPLIRRVWVWGLVLGVIGNLVYTVGSELSMRNAPSLMLMLSLIGQTFGAPALSLFYVTSLVLLTRDLVWHQRLLPLAAVGRMAITNYLLQTVICTTLMYGYGFGLYGQVGPAIGIALTFVLYGLQIPWSLAWLQRFRFGPVEWLWRTLTYGHLQSMRLT